MSKTNNQFRVSFYLLLVAASILLPSCSSTAHTDSGGSNASLPAEIQKTRYHVIVISGFESDPTPAQIAGTSPRGVGNSGMYQLMGDLKEKGLNCSFYNWNGTDAGNMHSPNAPGAKRIVVDLLNLVEQDPNVEFIIVGHSWGGHTLLDVAHELVGRDTNVTITHTIVIDPSSLMRGNRAEKLPENIPSMINYYTGNAFCWGAWDGEPRITNVELGDPENGFSIDGHPNYGSKFDTNAHTAAEWDEKIHADTCKRVVEVTEQ